MAVVRSLRKEDGYTQDYTNTNYNSARLHTELLPPHPTLTHDTPHSHFT
jgi:hypothetical protein